VCSPRRGSPLRGWRRCIRVCCPGRLRENYNYVIARSVFCDEAIPQLEEEIAHLPLRAVQGSQRVLAMTFKQRGVQSAQGKSDGRVEVLHQSMLSSAFAGEL